MGSKFIQTSPSDIITYIWIYVDILHREGDLRLIRPFVYVRETHLREFAEQVRRAFTVFPPYRKNCWVHGTYAKSGSPLHRENGENGNQKNPQGIWFAQVVNSLILNIQNIAIFELNFGTFQSQFRIWNCYKYWKMPREKFPVWQGKYRENTGNLQIGFELGPLKWGQADPLRKHPGKCILTADDWNCPLASYHRHPPIIPRDPDYTPDTCKEEVYTPTVFTKYICLVFPNRLRLDSVPSFLAAAPSQN